MGWAAKEDHTKGSPPSALSGQLPTLPSAPSVPSLTMPLSLSLLASPGCPRGMGDAEPASWGPFTSAPLPCPLVFRQVLQHLKASSSRPAFRQRAAMGLLPQARAAVARQQGCWSAAVVTPKLFQFAVGEEENSWRNSLICSPAGTPVPWSMVRRSPLRASPTHLALPRGHLITWASAPPHPHSKEGGTGLEGRAPKGPSASLSDKALELPSH